MPDRKTKDEWHISPKGALSYTEITADWVWLRNQCGLEILVRRDTGADLRNVALLLG